jgi:hypothetical protein
MRGDLRGRPDFRRTSIHDLLNARLKMKRLLPILLTFAAQGWAGTWALVQHPAIPHAPALERPAALQQLRPGLDMYL